MMIYWWRQANTSPSSGHRAHWSPSSPVTPQWTLLNTETINIGIACDNTQNGSHFVPELKMFPASGFHHLIRINTISSIERIKFGTLCHLLSHY